MNICVYGASSNDIDKEYVDKVYEFGKKLAARGHSLVFGAGGQGLMGAVARGVKDGGGYITGVTPTFFNVDGILYDKCDKLITTDTMRERKHIMEESADAFVMVPGGVGTFEEFFEILTLKQLGRHGKAIVVFNIKDYYEPLLDMMKTGAEKGFMLGATNEIYQVMTDVDGILDYLEAYEPEVGKVFKF
jgi:uncharacterized protein (TIGR00730 family)